jgi:hypothetical protein
MHRHAKARIRGYRKPAQTIQPWQFGHGETKATCLWLKNLPALRPTAIVEGRLARVHRMSPGPRRALERSRTFSGIAEAMAMQWGDLPATYADVPLLAFPARSRSVGQPSLTAV